MFPFWLAEQALHLPELLEIPQDVLINNLDIIAVVDVVAVYVTALAVGL